MTTRIASSPERNLSLAAGFHFVAKARVPVCPARTSPVGRKGRAAFVVLGKGLSTSLHLLQPSPNGAMMPAKGACLWLASPYASSC